MKKVFFALTTVIMLLAVSCKKDNNAPVALGENEFMATIDNGAMPQNAPRIDDGMSTKTTISEGKYIYWSNNDGISVNGYSLTTTQSGTTVTFTSATAVPDATEYHAFYPASIAGSGAAGNLSQTQTYNPDNVDNLPMYAHSTTRYLTFNNICAVLKITVFDYLAGATSIEVSSANQKMWGAFTITDNAAVFGAPANDDDKKITVTKTGGAAFAADEVVYVAVPAAQYQELNIKFLNGTTTMWSKAIPTCTLNVNTIYPINISNLLPGEFSVSATKKVKFTRGNLWYNRNTSTWGFEANQYDIPPMTPNYNTGYQGSYRYTADASHIGQFFWSNDASVAYADEFSGSNSGTAFFNNLTVGGETYTGLTVAEWRYLTGYKDGASDPIRTNAASLCAAEVSVNGVYGMLLAPDGCTTFDKTKTSYTLAEWRVAEAAGVVFLPNAGKRTQLTTDKDKAYIYLDKNSADGANYGGCYWATDLGYSNNSYAAKNDKSNRQGLTDLIAVGSLTNSNGSPVRLVKVVTNP